VDKGRCGDEANRVLDERELQEVYLRALEVPFPFGSIIQLLILTGQRRTEIGSLRRSWVVDGQVIFPEGFAKNKREHRFPLSGMGREIVEGLPDTGDFLFPAATNIEKPFSGWAWHKARFDEGLEDVGAYTLHDLRRTFATIHAKIGTPIHVTEKLLNHVAGTINGVAAVYTPAVTTTITCSPRPRRASSLRRRMRFWRNSLSSFQIGVLDSPHLSQAKSSNTVLSTHSPVPMLHSVQASRTTWVAPQLLNRPAAFA
jgi:Phage integrase family